jgi:hypothetical protein
MLTHQRALLLNTTAVITLSQWNWQEWLLGVYRRVSELTTQVQLTTVVVMMEGFVVTKIAPFAIVPGTR